MIRSGSVRRAICAAFIVAMVGVMGAALPACEGLFGSSKVAQGQRYQADDQRYDPYFEAVHNQQVAAAAWPDEKKTAHRPLVAALSLTPGASDDFIVNATRDRAKKSGGGAKLDLASAHATPVNGASDTALFNAASETARLELERARKLKAANDKLEELSKQGEELKRSSDQDYANSGAAKADEKKTEKSREIRRELGGAVDVTRSLGRDASKHARAAQDFLDDLADGLEAKDATPRSREHHGDSKAAPPPPPPPKIDTPKDDPPPKKDDSKPAKSTKPATPPLTKPKALPPGGGEKPPDPPPKPDVPPKPATPPPPPPDEVFNP